MLYYIIYYILYFIMLSYIARALYFSLRTPGRRHGQEAEEKHRVAKAA